MPRRLLDERDIERVEVWGPHNDILYSGSNPEAAADQHSGRSSCGTDVQHAGSLEIWMSRAEMQETLSSIRTQLLSKQGIQTKRIRGVFTVITVPLFILGLLGAWFIARRLSGPIAALVKSADRIGDGDYTRPLAVRAPRRTRRSAICARAHAAEPERNDHHQELPEYRAQQLERRGVRHLARRHRQELQ